MAGLRDVEYGFAALRDARNAIQPDGMITWLSSVE
jgi:hypothetical protein